MEAAGWKSPARESRACIRHIHVSLVVFPFSTQLFVAILLTRQPFFIGGIDDVQHAKESAFGAMYAFIVTFCASLILWYRDARKKRRGLILTRHVYEQVPPMHPIESYEINLDLPTSVTQLHLATTLDHDEPLVPDVPTTNQLMPTDEGIFA